MSALSEAPSPLGLTRGLGAPWELQGRSGMWARWREFANGPTWAGMCL